jgi:hypothetical protein
MDGSTSIFLRINVPEGIFITTYDASRRSPGLPRADWPGKKRRKRYRSYDRRGKLKNRASIDE